MTDERRKQHPLGALGDGKTARAVGLGGVLAVLPFIAWLDSRYAQAKDVPSVTSVVRAEDRLARIEEELKELRIDVKEIMRRLPR